MHRTTLLAAIAALLVGAGRVAAQSVNFSFTDGTSDGWSDSGFGGSPLSTVTNITGSNYIEVPIGGFQVANVSTGDTSTAFFQAMAAAMANPSGYDLSYNWYVNTATFTGASPTSFLQLGSFVNGGDGAYNQDFGNVKEVQLSGAQLSSGNVFQGQVSVNLAAAGLVLPDTETFYRLGLIENGDGGVPYQVEFTNISIGPVPEPASLGLLGTAGLGLLGMAGLGLLRRRRSCR